MSFRKGFTLTEILIAIVLMGLIVLAVTSVDIVSHHFFDTSSSQSRIQDEAKITMEHIIKNVQQGVGDMTNPGTSEGFAIYDSGDRIRVKLDDDQDGMYTGSPPDRKIEYRYNFAGDPENTIVFVHDILNGADVAENLAEGVVQDAIFSFDVASPNQLEVTITVRRHPDQDPSLDNPETTLTSSIILRAMSTN